MGRPFGVAEGWKHLILYGERIQLTIEEGVARVLVSIEQQDNQYPVRTSQHTFYKIFNDLHDLLEFHRLKTEPATPEDKEPSSLYEGHLKSRQKEIQSSNRIPITFMNAIATMRNQRNRARKQQTLVYRSVPLGRDEEKVRSNASGWWEDVGESRFAPPKVSGRTPSDIEMAKKKEEMEKEYATLDKTNEYTILFAVSYTHLTLPTILRV